MKRPKFLKSIIKNELSRRRFIIFILQVLGIILFLKGYIIGRSTDNWFGKLNGDSDLGGFYFIILSILILLFSIWIKKNVKTL